MANEITFAQIEGDLAYDYRLLAESIVSSRYSYDNLRDIVWTKDISSFPTDSERFPIIPTVAATTLTDGTDLSANTAFNPTNITIAVAEVGLKMTLTDLGRTGGMWGDNGYAAEAGKAVLEKITTDIAAVGGAFSQTVGTTGVDLTETNFEDAIITLIGNNSPEDLVAVFNERQWFDLVNSIGSAISPLNSTGSSARAESNDLGLQRQGMAGRLYGVDVRINPLVPTANAAADRAGFMMVKSRTIGHVVKWGIRPEFERDASLRGTEAVVTACYAVGEIEDETGVGIVTDA